MHRPDPDAIARTLADRRLDALGDARIAQLDDHLARAHGPGGEHRAVEHQVRQPRQQQPVLAGRGLGLAAVDDDRAHPAAGGNRAQLAGRREVGAAAAAQAAALHRIDQLAATEARHRPVHALVLKQPR